MADTIIDGTLLKITDLKYTSLKPNEKGGKSLNVLNKFTNSGLRLSTPLMLTWGASDFVDQDGNGNGKFEMSMQFPQEEYSNADCDAFLQNMKSLEKKIKEDALTYSKDWFGKVHKSSDIIDELFTPMLKYPRIKGTSEPDYSKKPILRVKLPQWQNAWKSEIYDEEGSILFPNKENNSITPLDYLKKGAMVACVIQCGGIWFTNGKFTITWKLLQAVVQKPKGNIAGQCLIRLKPQEKEQLQKSAPPDDVDVEDSINAHVEDSDDDESTPAPKVEAVPKAVPVEVAVEQEIASIVQDEIKPKKKIIRKKTATAGSEE